MTLTADRLEFIPLYKAPEIDGVPKRVNRGQIKDLDTGKVVLSDCIFKFACQSNELARMEHEARFYATELNDEECREYVPRFYGYFEGGSVKIANASERGEGGERRFSCIVLQYCGRYVKERDIPKQIFFSDDGSEASREKQRMVL